MELCFCPSCLHLLNCCICFETQQLLLARACSTGHGPVQWLNGLRLHLRLRGGNWEGGEGRHWEGGGRHWDERGRDTGTKGRGEEHWEEGGGDPL